jgi:hypothetical protein
MTDVDEQLLEGRVQAQYESFPYPNIPAVEAGEFVRACMPSDLLAINRYILRGVEIFRSCFGY